jgi:DNA-binding response OmpR family regulator
MVSRKPGRRTAVVGENARYEGELVRAFLEEEGFRTSVTDDPHRLEKLIKTKKPDLVVMNSFVGDIPGHILAEALMDAGPAKRKVVLLISPTDDIPHKEAHSIIRKPVSRGEVRKVIRDLFPPK